VLDVPVTADAASWAVETSDLEASLDSRPAGLSSAIASERLAEAGANSVDETRRHGNLLLIARQFENPIVLILLVAATISLVLRQWVDAGIVLTIVLGSAALGFFQEHRASTAVDALKRRLALTARVLRDGGEKVLPIEHIVPGDVIVLSAGNLVPADGRVLAAQDFLVSEAASRANPSP
jgi:P-type Mg2+ transporter